MIVRIQFVSVFKDGKLEVDFPCAVFAVDEKLPFRILMQKIKSRKSNLICRFLVNFIYQ